MVFYTLIILDYEQKQNILPLMSMSFWKYVVFRWICNYEYIMFLITISIDYIVFQFKKTTGHYDLSHLASHADRTLRARKE